VQEHTSDGAAVPTSLGWHIGRRDDNRFYYKQGGGGGFRCMTRLSAPTAVLFSRGHRCPRGTC